MNSDVEKDIWPTVSSVPSRTIQRTLQCGEHENPSLESSRCSTIFRKPPKRCYILHFSFYTSAQFKLKFFSGIYMQSNKIHKFFQWVSLFSTYVSSTCFGPHLSITRSVFYKLYSQTLVCGNTVRTTRHVQLNVSSSTRITTYQICEYSL